MRSINGPNFLPPPSREEEMVVGDVTTITSYQMYEEPYKTRQETSYLVDGVVTLVRGLVRVKREFMIAGLQALR